MPPDQGGTLQQRRPAGGGRYDGAAAVLATRHDKLPLIAPAFASLGLSIEVAEVDTDVLGTFSGEIERTASQWDTAVAKARLGMQATGATIGIASEGSIGPNPAMPYIVSAAELVVIVDDELGIVVGETEVLFDIVVISFDIAPGEPLDDYLRRAEFPEHGLIARPAVGRNGPIHKGLHDRDDLVRAIAECAGASGDGRARVSTDLRAHHCPSRRPIIAAAAARLAARLDACCPACATPGWGVVRADRGAPCAACGTPVDIVVAYIEGCQRCAVELRLPLPGRETADPSRCYSCNP